jgi:hypothetical protein
MSFAFVFRQVLRLSGLNGGEDGGFCGLGLAGGLLGGFGVGPVEPVDEGADGGDGSGGFGDFSTGCEGAEKGVGDDIFDGGGWEFGVFFLGCGAWEVAACDLETVEEEAGAFGVDLVAGDAAEDLAEGELDGGAVFGEGDVEVGLTGAAFAWVFDGAAGGVVVVTKFFVAEAWAATAMATGEDVAALEAFGGVG